MQGYEVINRSTIFLMTVFRGKWKEDLRLQNLYSIWQFNTNCIGLAWDMILLS